MARTIISGGSHCNRLRLAEGPRSPTLAPRMLGERGRQLRSPGLLGTVCPTSDWAPMGPWRWRPDLRSTLIAKWETAHTVILLCLLFEFTRFSGPGGVGGLDLGGQAKICERQLAFVASRGLQGPPATTTHHHLPPPPTTTPYHHPPPIIHVI